jgi:hypothetical protein
MNCALCVFAHQRFSGDRLTAAGDPGLLTITCKPTDSSSGVIAATISFYGIENSTWRMFWAAVLSPATKDRIDIYVRIVITART